MDGSPLQKVAPEIRNRIYELVLQSREPLEIPVLHESNRSRSKWSPTALIQVCKQIRGECSQVLYSTNAFRVTRLLSVEPLEVINAFKAFTVQIGGDNSQSLRAVHLRGFDLRGNMPEEVYLVMFQSALEEIRLLAKSLPRCAVTVEVFIRFSMGGSKQVFAVLDMKDFGEPWIEQARKLNRIIRESSPEVAEELERAKQRIGACRLKLKAM